jgi:micrococcal nuclease
MTATVDYALNGDTLELLFELSADVPATQLRLTGVQAPSLGQDPWGTAARECLSDLRNEIITVTTNDWTVDPYGRVWVDAWHGQEWLNQRVLAQGCGYLSGDRLAEPQNFQSLMYAQEAARLLGLGIWDPQQPLRNPA